MARKEAAWKKKKQEIMKRNETEMAEDRMEEARETKKRRMAAAEAVKAALRGHRLQKTSVDGEVKDTDGELWDDGEVSFLHEVRPEEAAEAHDTGGRRERSHSGANEASEARRSKESG